MKIARTIFAGCLLLLLNFAVVAYAQDDKNDSAKPAQQDEAKPGTAKPQDPMPPQEEKRTQQEQNSEQGKDRQRQAEEQKTQQSGEAKRAQQEQGKEQNEQNRASTSGNEQNRNRTAQRIPDDKFRVNFGREHHFRISQPVIVENRPRFQYSSYWFEIVDVWPVGWSYSDDCYIDYIDGQYFLINILHPDVRVALVIVVS
jgi:flagellar motor protein MotB